MKPTVVSLVLCASVATVADEVVGFGAGNPESVYHISSLFVAPQWRGRGIGRYLVRELESQLKDLGVATPHLAAAMNAVPFYRALGYSSGAPLHLIFEHPRYLEQTKLEAIHMWKGNPRQEHHA